MRIVVSQAGMAGIGKYLRIVVFLCRLYNTYTILCYKVEIVFNFMETFRKMLALLHFFCLVVASVCVLLDNAALLFPLWKRPLPFIKLVLNFCYSLCLLRDKG